MPENLSIILEAWLSACSVEAGYLGHMEPRMLQEKGGRMKERKPIELEFAGTGGHLKLIGRADKSLPYITVYFGQRFACVPDKAIKRLRDWCDEILRSRRES